MSAAPLGAIARIVMGGGVFTLVNTFDVEPGKQPQLVASLRAVTERTMCRLPGFVATSVHASLDGRRVVNYVQWQSRAHFDAMFEDDEARAHMAEVSALATRVTPVFYDVVYVGASS